MRYLKISFFAAALLFMARPVIAADAPQGAGELWQKTLAAYAAVASYSDTGVITTEFGTGGTRLRETHKFKTALIRPR